MILVTLVGRGTALRWVIGRLGWTAAGTLERAQAEHHEVAARVAGVDAVPERIDALDYRESGSSGPGAR